MDGLKNYLLFLTALTLCLAASAALAGPSDSTAFSRVNLVTMTDDRILADQTVIIKNGLIQSFGPWAEIPIPAGTRVINGQGKYLMPGLCDMHVHIRAAWPRDPLQLYLANGVTTIRDLNGRANMLEWKREIRQGLRPGPNLIISTPTIYGFEPQPWTLLEKYQAGDYDCVKVYSFHSPESLRQTLAAAKALDKWVVGHNSIKAGLAKALDWGLDEVAHVEELAWELITYNRNAEQSPKQWYYLFVQKLAELAKREKSQTIAGKMGQVLSLLQRKNAALNTTLAVTEAMDLKVNHLQDFLNLPSSRFLPPEYLLKVRAGLDKHQLMLAGHKKMAPLFMSWLQQGLKMAVDSGLLVSLGTDSGARGLGVVPGFSMHDELRLISRAGLSPYQTLVLATRNAGILASRMGSAEGFGVIEPGKRADLLLLEADPLTDLKNVGKISGVMVRGRWLDRQTLDQMLEPPQNHTAAQIR